MTRGKHGLAYQVFKMSGQYPYHRVKKGMLFGKPVHHFTSWVANRPIGLMAVSFSTTHVRSMGPCACRGGGAYNSFG